MGADAGAYAVGDGERHGALGKGGVATRKDAGYARFLRCVGLEERAFRPLFKFAPELLGEPSGQARPRHDEKSRQCAGASVLETQHDALFGALSGHDLLRLDGDAGCAQLGKLIRARLHSFV